jgi:antitoxin (DNA-binding transcriptional repressor) of toxin-antitoxin stability system
MPTPDELRAELAAARRDFADALRAVQAGTWERRPASGEGEDAWSAREAAEHCIAADVAYASAVCLACGYPGLERFEAMFATPGDALAGLEQASALADGRLKYVTDKDLEMQNQRGITVAQIMTHGATHFRDHAAQIRTAAGVA